MKTGAGLNAMHDCVYAMRHVARKEVRPMVIEEANAMVVMVSNNKRFFVATFFLCGVPSAEAD